MLHNRHKGGYERESMFLAEVWHCHFEFDAKHFKLNKIAKIAKIRGKMSPPRRASYPLRREIDVLFFISVYEGQGVAHSHELICLKHVHILFTRASRSSPAAGLRLEIATNIDKKKSELYFYFSVKKFLTEKAKRACA